MICSLRFEPIYKPKYEYGSLYMTWDTSSSRSWVGDYGAEKSRRNTTKMDIEKMREFTQMGNNESCHTSLKMSQGGCDCFLCCCGCLYDLDARSSSHCVFVIFFYLKLCFLFFFQWKKVKHKNNVVKSCVKVFPTHYLFLSAEREWMKNACGRIFFFFFFLANSGPIIVWVSLHSSTTTAIILGCRNIFISLRA